MSSLWLVCLSLLVAADAASLGGRPVDIPVQVVYEAPLRSIEDGPVASRLVSVKNLDAKLQLSPEEIVEADVLNIPVTIAKIAAENIDQDALNVAEEALKVSSESSSEESDENKSPDSSSDEDSKEDETNEVNSDKNTLEGINKPVTQDQVLVVPVELTPPISIVDVPVSDVLVPAILPLVPGLVPPPLVGPEVVQQEVFLIPEAVLPPQLQEQLAGNIDKGSEQEQVQEINNLKSLLPDTVGPEALLVEETSVVDTDNKLIEEVVKEELVQEEIKLKSTQELNVPPNVLSAAAAAVPVVPELYPQEQVNILVQLRAANPEVPAGSEQNQPVQVSTTQAPSRPLAGLFNRLGENIGNALNSIRPSTTVAPVPTTTTTAADTTEANASNNINRVGEETAAAPVEAAIPVSSTTAAPPATNLLGGIQQNVNTQLGNFGNRFNSFIDNLRPKQTATVQNDEEVTTPSTPFLNTIQQQFNSGLTGFSNSVNSAFNFINQNGNNATQPGQQSDEQPTEQQPGNPFIQQITSASQQFQQQFTSFVQGITGQQQQQQQQQSDEEPEAATNNSTNFGQQVLTTFQNGLNTFWQNLNRPADQTNTQGTQSDENATPAPANSGGLLGGIQGFANNIGQQINTFLSGQNTVNPAQGIPTQVSQAGQQLVNASQNIPGAQQIQAGISQIPGGEQIQNLQGNLPGAEQIQNLQGNLPGAGQIQNLQGNLPGAEQIQNLQGNLPGAEQIQNLQGNLPGAEQITNLQQNLPGAEQIANLQQNLPGAGNLQEILPAGKEIQNLEEKPSAAEETQNAEQVQKWWLALWWPPREIQEILDVVTQQVDRIVGPVKDPNVEENDEDDNDGYTLDETDRVTEKRTGEIETVEKTSVPGFDKVSYQEDREEQGGGRAGGEGDEEDESERALEMLQATPEPEENLTREEHESQKMEQDKVDKKQKIDHWNNIWPWGDHISKRIYRDSNTHLVRSSAIDSKKINFLKYTPPPQTFERLKHSEVYRQVHNVDPPVRGVQMRQGKATVEEDYHAQIQSSSQDGTAQQIKG